MKKQKTKKSTESDISENDLEAIEKAASALNAFEGEQMDFANEPVAEEPLLKEISDGLEIWEASDEAEAFLENEAETDPHVSDEAASENQVDVEVAPVDGTELADFESAEIEDVEFVSDEQMLSIIESVLFANDRPVSAAFFRQMFKGTNVKIKDIRAAIERLASEYASPHRGVTLEEVSSGFQLRTKLENVRFLRQSVKARPFKLSGPALEVLSIVAYKQPCTKAQIDEIRGVESGHLLRALMEKSIVSFGERSDLPGKPMFYETTRKFLEIFGLRNVRELPSLHEIDQLIPEGIGGDEKKETLADLTGELSQQAQATYSQGEEELLKITDELSQITTSSEFFDQEKQRLKDKKDQERAQDVRERIAIGETVEDKDVRWLERYDEAQLLKAQGAQEVDFVTDLTETIQSEANPASHGDLVEAATETKTEVSV